MMIICLAIFVIWLIFITIKLNKENKKSHERRDKAFEYFQVQDAIRKDAISMNPIYFKVKGTSYRSSEEISAARFCNKGDVLILVPEPNNPVDPNAIKVYTIDGVHIGYVEAAYSQDISRNINHILDCVVSRISTREIPYIYAIVRFTSELTKQPEFIKKDFQCSPEQRMQNLSSVPLDAYKYRRVVLMVEGLYELDRFAIAKARTSHKGDKIILKKGECNEYYPYRIEIFLEDGTYIGHADNMYSGEVYNLFDYVVDSFVDSPICRDTANRIAVSVIFPVEIKCPNEFLPTPGISFSYKGQYPEVKTAQELRKTNPLAALDILQPIVKREKGIDARIECIACYYHLKDWESRINIINETIQHINALTEEDLPSDDLNRLYSYMPTLVKQLEYSQKRLDAATKNKFQ